MPKSLEEVKRFPPIRQVEGKTANELEFKVSKWLDKNNIAYIFQEKIMASRKWIVDFLIPSPSAVIECKYSKSDGANPKIQSGEAFMLLMDLKYNSEDNRISKNRTKFVFIHEALPPKGKELGDYAKPFRSFGIEVCQKDWKKHLLKVLKL